MGDDPKNPDSHIAFFESKGKRFGNRLITMPGEEISAERQKARRVETVGQAIADALGAPSQQMAEAMTTGRLAGATDDSIMKVTWDEFLRIKQDPAFRPASGYMPSFFFYTGPDGHIDTSKPRRVPIRQLLRNEVGTIFFRGADRIVCLHDAAPGDREGVSIQVPGKKDDQ